MVNVKTIFNVLSGNSGITESLIYSYTLSTDTKYEVLSSSTSDKTKLGYIPKCNNLKGEKISIFENTLGILVVRKGKAGLLSFLKKGLYTINDDAYILFLKDDFKIANGITNENDEEVFLKWFIYKHQHNLYEYASNSDNGTWNKTAFLKYCEIDIDNKKTQTIYSTRYNSINSLKSKLIDIDREVEILLNKNISLDLSKYNKTLKINEILSYVSRNDALSEEGIYNNVRHKDDEVISVLSGSLSKEIYGEIALNTDKVHYLSNNQGLVVTSRGKAGRLRYLKKGTYATNTNAFIFYLNDAIKKELNIKSEQDETKYLKFLKIYLEPIFINLSSNSDVSVFPLTKIFEEMELPLIKLNVEIENIVNRYEKIYCIKETINNEINKTQELLNKELEL
ncbi:MAG: hypothetical protein GQ540_05945 [Lutibacter sp.]|uniref:hypothetical protein n=1 Tax=Lutibacter sp. TaxID=1925666 RepID=UPI0019DB768E|nr:hypothetical protein [Lutibacter sp.]NOR28052.1 hypothetical protein [Lutibacter sp.]